MLAVLQIIGHSDMMVTGGISFNAHIVGNTQCDGLLPSLVVSTSPVGRMHSGIPTVGGARSFPKACQ